MKVESLNCPNCGAGVATDHSRCDFCKTRLKTVGCSSCFGLMFAGSKFCGHCGIPGTDIELALNGGKCPRCKKPLEGLEIGEASLFACATCDGMWTDAATFEDICAQAELQSTVLGSLAGRKTNAKAATIKYVPCPSCEALMNRHNFAKASGVIVDVCKPHGVWFDAGELPAIVAFIQKGGMEIARQRERNEIEQERERIRDERRRIATEPRSSRLGAIVNDEFNSDTRSFVRKLLGI